MPPLPARRRKRAATPRSGCVGPLTLGQSFPFVAYVHRLGEGLPMLCTVAHLDDHRTLLERMAQVVEESYRHVDSQLMNWRDSGGIVADLVPGSGDLTIHLYSGHEPDPRDFGHAVLRSVTWTFVREVAGVRCVVTQYAPEGNEIRCRFDVGVPGATESPQPGCSVYLEDDPEHVALDEAIGRLLALSKTDLLAEADQGLFLSEAATLGEPLAVFRSFSHAAVLNRDPASTDVLLGQGRRAWDLLAGHSMFDYAEWVAATMQRLAHSAGDPVAEVGALRLQGISQAGLGCWGAATSCFERALRLLPRAADAPTEAMVHMSYGLAICDLCAHWEALDVQTRARQLPDLLPRLDIAERELLAARESLGTLHPARAHRNQAFITLELARIRDLRGDHQAALAIFTDLDERASGEGTNGPDLAEPDLTRYRATAAHYRLCAALKLSELEVARPAADEGDDVPATARLLEELTRAAAHLDALPLKAAIVDRLCYVALLAAKFWVGLALDLHAAAPASRRAAAAPGSPTPEDLREQLQGARDNLETALGLQRARESREARPPASGIEYGGMAAMDIVGTLQASLLLLATIAHDPTSVWRAFAVADESKGRFFKRDLAFSGWTPVRAASGPASAATAGMREALVHGGADHRLVIADLEWRVRQDLSAEALSEFRRATALEAPLRADDLQALLAGASTPTAVLAFYAAEANSLAYVVSSADRPPQVTRLVVRIDELERMAHDLGTTGAVPPALERLAGPLLHRLPDVRRLLIVPHGAWHGIPIHVLLLPALWKAGREVGIAYAPSVRAMLLLQQRRDARRLAQRSAIAVATVPAREDPQAAFEDEHLRLLGVLRDAGRPVDPVFGCEATLDRVLGQSEAAGIRHLIAHGLDAGSDQAMQSGVLVADGSGLPSRSDATTPQPMLTAALELAHPTAASHVTLQACEIGRLHGGHRDELWGMVRAVIAGGASSVLAPAWDISLRSSGALLRDFYRRWLVAGDEPALALARAQHAMANGENPEWRSCSHWGAFQLTGC